MRKCVHQINRFVLFENDDEQSFEIYIDEESPMRQITFEQVFIVSFCRWQNFSSFSSSSHLLLFCLSHGAIVISKPIIIFTVPSYSLLWLVFDTHVEKKKEIKYFDPFLFFSFLFHDQRERPFACSSMHRDSDREQLKKKEEEEEEKKRLTRLVVSHWSFVWRCFAGFFSLFFFPIDEFLHAYDIDWWSLRLVLLLLLLFFFFSLKIRNELRRKSKKQMIDFEWISKCEKAREK